MLLNGKEVNHLIIGGECFDKSIEQGIKVRIKVNAARYGRVTLGGSINNKSNGGGTVLSKGTVCIGVAKYKNAICVANTEVSYDSAETSWVSLDDVEFLK